MFKVFSKTILVFSRAFATIIKSRVSFESFHRTRFASQRLQSLIATCIKRVQCKIRVGGVFLCVDVYWSQSLNQMGLICLLIRV